MCKCKHVSAHSFLSMVHAMLAGGMLVCMMCIMMHRQSLAFASPVVVTSVVRQSHCAT